MCFFFGDLSYGKGFNSLLGRPSGGFFIAQKIDRRGKKGRIRWGKVGVPITRSRHRFSGRGKRHSLITPGSRRGNFLLRFVMFLKKSLLCRVYLLHDIFCKNKFKIGGLKLPGT